jgi:hypothetical protein
MTENEKQIARLLVGLAEYLQATMSREQMQMYVREFDSPEYLGACIIALKQDPDIRSGFMPLPAKIKASLDRSIEDHGYETVQKILRLASDVGQYRTAEARDTMGPVAWSVVQAYGGWGVVCQVETKNMGTAFAQLRDLSMSMEKVNRMGVIRGRVGIGEHGAEVKRVSERGDEAGELVHQKLEALAKRIGSDK